MYIQIDIDDVCANTMEIWLNKYNKYYKDNLTKEQISDWNISMFVKPECGNKIYDFLKYPSLYKHVEPIPDALEGVNSFRSFKDIKIIYCTDSSMSPKFTKLKWLQDHGFWQYGDYYIETPYKFLLRGDIIIDDNPKNIAESNCHLKILFNRPWNKYFEWTHRVDGWKQIINLVNEYKEKMKEQ